MLDLEKRVLGRGDLLMQEFKTEFQSIIDKKIATVEGLTNESYKKTLQLLLELE